MWHPQTMFDYGMLCLFLVVMLPVAVLLARQTYIQNRTTPEPQTQPADASPVERPSFVEIEATLNRARFIRMPLAPEQRQELLVFAIALCGIGKTGGHSVFNAMRTAHGDQLRLFRATVRYVLAKRFPGICLPIDYTEKDGSIDYSIEDARTNEIINKVLDNPQLAQTLLGVCSIFNWELVSVYRDYCEQPGRPKKLSLIGTGVFDVLFRHATLTTTAKS